MKINSQHLLIAILPLALTAQAEAAPSKVPFSKVFPLLKAKCVSCHNTKSHPEKVDLSSYATVMKSGEHGPIVVPGHPDTSSIVLYVNGKKQPRMPMGSKPLKDAEIALLKNWILSGAGN